MSMSVQVVGLPAVQAKLRGKPDKIHTAIVRVVNSLGIDLQRRVKELLTGQSLNVRTGRLRRSITQATTDDGETIRSRTGTNVEYARRHELGFKGTEKVRAHARHVKSRNVREVVIRGYRDDGRAKLGRNTVGSGVAFVRPFTRNVDYPAHPFLRPALNERRDLIRMRITRAIGGASGR